MRRLLKRVVFSTAMALCLFASGTAPAGAYCNTDPCSTNRHLVCTMCSYYVEVDGGWCRVTATYCVDCHSGQILSWDESVDFCEYWVV